MDPLLLALFIAWWITHLIKEAPYALRGKTSPRMQLKLDKAKRKAAGGSTTPGPARGFWSNVWRDGWADAERVRQNRRDKASRGELWRQRLAAKAKEGAGPLANFIGEGLVNAFARIGRIGKNKRGKKPEDGIPEPPPETPDPDEDFTKYEPYDIPEPPVAEVIDINKNKDKEPAVSDNSNNGNGGGTHTGETPDISSARAYAVAMSEKLVAALAQHEGALANLRNVKAQCQNTVNSAETSIASVEAKGLKGTAVSALRNAFAALSQVVHSLDEADGPVAACVDPLTAARQAFDTAVAEYDRQHVVKDATSAVGNDNVAEKTSFYTNA